MKQARALYEMGRVSSATWSAPMLQGRVREGETEYRAGLKILSKSNVENLCGCRDSRQRGMICAHSVAVGLEVLKPHPQPASPSPVSAPVAQSEKSSAKSNIPLPPVGPTFHLDRGEPAQLFVILPPNFASAWQKGNVTIGFEIEKAGKRMLLSALPKNGEFQCSEADARAIEGARKILSGEVPGMASLSRPQFLQLLEAMVDHPRVNFGRGAKVQIHSDGLMPALIVTKEDNESVRLRVDLPAGALALVGGPQPWLFSGNEFRPLAPGLAAPYHDLLVREIVLPAAHAETFLRQELPALRTSLAFDDLEMAPEEEAPTVAAPELALHLEGSLNHLTGRLEFRYGDHAPFSASSTSQRTSYPRDLSAERVALGRLQGAGFSGPDATGQLVLKGEPRILAFFARELPWWERHAEAHIGARFQHVTRNVERIEPRLEIRSSGQNWFDLQVELAATGGERFSGAEIQRLIQSGQSHLKRKNGSIAVFDPAMLDEFNQVLRDCDPSQPQPGTYRIDRRNAAFLESFANEQGASLQAPPEWRSWATATRQLDQLQPISLGSLEETLRPYQKQGVYWLNFLAKNGLGGILADEMGLGKTVQALTFLRQIPGKALIVCPSSLTYNWRREAERFTPDRQVLVIEGPNRQPLFGEPLRQANLVITSYALLRRDADLYRDIEFSAAILDEAQHIKNPESQNAQSAFAIRANHRFILTGTPVENSVRDIWALMNFAMPGYLGTRADFRERFEQAISSQPGGPEHQRLVKRLKPFILRRLKQSVITDLPEKIEQISYCELTDAQRELYGQLVSATRRQVADMAGSKDQNKARMLMLTALLRLRQACCDLRLLDTERPATADDSAKIGLLGELLQEAIDGGHRVLVFSQFATMLGLLRDWLKELEIDFCHLDGSTRDRAAQVDRFQRGATPVFLVSLKAGGVGLNLTAADTVVHFDPWWNPAVEAQATDRAHRIGQKKVVTAYKLIARGTVEEKILTLQAKKKEIIAATLESEQPLMQGLSMQEIQDLLV